MPDRVASPCIVRNAIRTGSLTVWPVIVQKCITYSEKCVAHFHLR